MSTTAFDTQSQILCWHGGSVDGPSWPKSLAEEKFESNLNIVENAGQFSKALDHPRVKVIVTNDSALSSDVNGGGDLMNCMKSRCPDAVLIVITQDESKIPSELRESINHLLSINQLDQLAPLLRRALGSTKRLWTLKDAQVNFERKSRLWARIMCLYRAAAPIQERLELCARHIVPELADVCIFDIQDEDGLMRRAVCVAKNADFAALSPALKADFPIFRGDLSTAGDALRGEGAILFNTPGVLSDFLGAGAGNLRSELEKFKATSALSAPIACFGGVMGLVTVLSMSDSAPFDETDKPHFEQLGMLIGFTQKIERGESRVDALPARFESSAIKKDAFLGTLSHELRTPLQAMLGWTQILRENHLKPEFVGKALDALEVSIKSQSKIVTDLLDLSNINSGKLDLSIRPGQLKPQLESVLAAFEVSAGIKQIELSLLPEEDPQLWVKADAIWLKRAFWNILSNAVKFTPEGGRVQVEILRDGNYALVRFLDTGIGIAPEHLPKVFEYFSQADHSTTRAHEGLGVGMVITRFVIEAHGGTISAESKGKDLGSVFIVKLPLCEAVVDEALDPVLEIAPDAEVSLSGVRVLVVEDERDTRDMLHFIFEQAGAQVLDADSAKSGLNALHASAFDIMVSDIGMPHEDGLALIRKVRALPAKMGGQIPALALSAYVGKEDRLEALRAGFQAYASKPIDVNELLLIVKSLVNKSSLS